MTLTIRSRLTLWYVAVLSLALLAFAAAFYTIHSRARLAAVDAELGRRIALVDRSLPADLDEGLDLPQAARDAIEDLELPGLFLAVFDGSGRLLAGRWDELPRPDKDELGDGGHATVATAAGAVRLERVRRRHRQTSYQVGAAESIASLERDLAGLRRRLAGSLLAALLLAVAGGFWIAHAALRPMAQMAVQAEKIDDRTPGFRLTAPHPEDELGRLASAFNDLLARLEAALAQQRSFMADASHELRTPVSVGRTAIEVTLGQGGRSEDEYRDSLAVVGEQMRRLSRLVEDMFTLARVDAAGLPVERRPVYLDELAADCAREARVLAASKGVAVGWQGPADLETQGDERRLRQMLMNLLGNAVRHTPSGGSVGIELAVRDGTVEVAVSDGGPGIPESEREHVFERFVRLDASRRPGEGAGLGLPIARAIAEAHGGTLVLARSDASGCTFLARLPLPPSS